VHVTGVRVSVPEDQQEGFLAALPRFLDDAYAEIDEEPDDDGPS
jgi:hypothetical protein